MKKTVCGASDRAFPSADACAGAGLLHPAGDQGNRRRTDGTRRTPTNMGGKRLWISTWRCTAGRTRPCSRRSRRGMRCSRRSSTRARNGGASMGKSSSGIKTRRILCSAEGAAKPLIVCHNYYDRLALDTVYGAEYGARNTLRDLTTRLYALLAQQRCGDSACGGQAAGIQRALPCR